MRRHDQLVAKTRSLTFQAELLDRVNMTRSLHPGHRGQGRAPALRVESRPQTAHPPAKSNQPEHHDRRTLPLARPLGRLHRAGRERPRGRLRAVRARSRAVEHARCHPGDGAFAAAHRAAGDPRGLARRQSAHRRRPLPRSVLGRGARRCCRRARARARHVRQHRDPRRLLRLVVGGTRAPCPQPAAAVPVPRRRLRRPGRQLQLRRGAIHPSARDRHVPAGGRPGHRLVVDRQAHAPDARVRRARHQERPGDLGRRRRPQHGAVAAGARRRPASNSSRSARSSPTRPTCSARSGFRSGPIPIPR